MNHVKVNSKTIRDNTGASLIMPILLIEQDEKIIPLWLLHEYLLKNQLKSITWQNKLIQAVGLLLDYIDSNAEYYSNPRDFFESFAEVIYSGTIDEEGYDPSGLYWLPKRSSTANTLLNQLSEFSDWLNENYEKVQLNPWRKASKYEERLNWMAITNKSHHSFLGHLDSSLKMSETARRARNLKLRRKTSSSSSSKAFPDDKIWDLLWKGFKKSDNISTRFNEYNWRDIAITILMHFGGLRISEPFHIWIQDVMADPNDPEIALVRVYHPIEGRVPRVSKDLKMPDGKHLSNRDAYLRIKYGIMPRNKLRGLKHAGWKNPKLSDSDQQYMHVFWFPLQWGKIFMDVWKLYMAQRVHEKTPDNHPFAFVSLSGANKGEMYTISAYRQSHAKAVQKIGLVVGKMHGTTEHGHRHAYGQRLKNAKLDENVIQAALHHKSIESQNVYTEPSIEQVTRHLSNASEILNEGQQLPMNFDESTRHYHELNMKKFLIRRRIK